MRHEYAETREFFDTMSFGEILRKKRRLLGLNQTDFAEIIGKEQTTISRWERGESSPPFEEARSILNFLGFDLKVPRYEGDRAEDCEIALEEIINDYVKYGITPITL